MQDAVATIISFASIGIYIAFQMVVIGALYARVTGWKPSGSFQLGKAGFVVNCIALVYGITAVTNMVWPRLPGEPWYINYGMIFTSAIVLLTGAIYVILGKPHLVKNK
jgi:amino acid transporter